MSNCVHCIYEGRKGIRPTKTYIIPGWGGPVQLCDLHANTVPSESKLKGELK